MMEIVKSQKDQLLEQYDKQKGLYQSFASEMEHQIKSILQATGIECNAIVSRLKTKESVAEKITRKQDKYNDISEITDIAGVRIITYYSEDVDKVSNIIECEFNVDQENSIDKRESMEPDRFGYCSVHYVVEMNAARLALREYQMYTGIKCEIQIRSVLQHAWAEIEHDIGYKSEITVPKEIRRNFSRLAGLLEIADKEFNEIRTTLDEYKSNATEQIMSNDFLEHEIDAVLLDILIDSDENIIKLNNHIEKYTGSTVKDFVGDSTYQLIIEKLNWLNITSIGQIADAIARYLDTAIDIANEMLKEYKDKEKTGNFNKTIALFYLCYAVLLKEHCTKKDIYNYLIDNNLGKVEERDATVNKLYDLGKSLK